MRRGTAIGCFCLLLVQAAAAVDTVFTHSPCVDEGQHLLSGVLMLRRGDPGYYIVNPPLVKVLAALPVAWELELPAGSRGDTIDEQVKYFEQFVQANRDRLPNLICRARCVLVAMLFGCGILIASLAGRLYGDAGALAATGIWAFNSMAVAWSAVVTTDIGTALFGLILVGVCGRFYDRPTWGRLTFVGFAMAAAILSKFTLLAFCPLALWAVFAATRRAGRSRIRATGMILIVVGLALVGVNLGYNMSGVGRPLGEFKFQSKAFTSKLGEGTPYLRVNRFAGGLLHDLPCVLSADFVLGIDEQKTHSDIGLPALVGATWTRDGRVYYYPLAFAWTMPDGMLLLLLPALVLALRRPSANLFVWLPAALIMFVLVAHPGMQGYPRYLLPALPFLAIACGQVASTGRWSSLLALACIALNAVEFARQHPRHLASFNLIARCEGEGQFLLGDFVTDAGQDLFLLRDWLATRPEVMPFTYHVVAGVDPTICGLPSISGPAITRTPGRHWMAVSSATLNGFDAVQKMKESWRTDDPRNPFAAFLAIRPYARIGGTIFVYQLENGIPVSRSTADGR